MKIKVEYTSDKLLPGQIENSMNEAKEYILELSREPDKVIILFDGMKRDIISWLAYHAKIES